MPRDKSSCSNLCYVASRQLTAPLMDPLDVWTTEGQRIGAFDGVVMDADEQRARYLVVDRGRFRPNRCLIPLPVQLDIVHQTLRVDADDLDLDHLPMFDARAFPDYRSVSRN